MATGMINFYDCLGNWRNSQSFTLNTAFNLSTDVPYVENYTFNYWYRTSYGYYLTYAPGQQVAFSQSIDLYGDYTYNPPLSTYYIEYYYYHPLTGNGPTYQGYQSFTEGVSQVVYCSPPSITGFNFDYWTDRSGQLVYYNGSTYTALYDNRKLYAHFSLKSYNVYFYTDSSCSTLHASTTINYSNPLHACSTVPTQTGKVFKDWYCTTNSTAYDPGELVASGISKNYTFYARWETQFAITCYGAGGSGGDVGTHYVTRGNTFYFSSTPPTLTNYTFQYWHNNTDTNNPKYLGDGITPTRDLSFTAVWTENPKYTITYNANGGTGAPASQTGYAGTTITISSTQPTRDGYQFDKWYYSTMGGGREYVSAGSSFTLDASHTFYAVWKEIYTVTYKSQGNTWKTDSAIEGVSYNIASGSPTHSNPDRYSFRRWYTSLTGQYYNYGDRIPGSSINQNFTLVADWYYKHFFTYYTDVTQSTIWTTVYHYHGDSASAISNVPTQIGKTFYKWHCVDNNTDYNSGETICSSTSPVNQDYDFYALWNYWKCTVSYSANGGTGAPSAHVTYNFGTTVTITDSIPKRRGYNFLGWQINGTGTLYHSSDTFVVNEDIMGSNTQVSITLYAKWSKISVNAFNWINPTDDNTYFQSNNPVSDAITANSWNLLNIKIETMYNNLKDTPIDIPSVITGDIITAQTFNSTRIPLQALLNDLNVSGSLVSLQNSGASITPNLFNGTNSNVMSLKDAVNAAIGFFDTL